MKVNIISTPQRESLRQSLGLIPAAAQSLSEYYEQREMELRDVIADIMSDDENMFNDDRLVTIPINGLGYLIEVASLWSNKNDIDQRLIPNNASFNVSVSVEECLINLKQALNDVTCQKLVFRYISRLRGSFNVQEVLSSLGLEIGDTLVSDGIRSKLAGMSALSAMDALTFWFSTASKPTETVDEYGTPVIDLKDYAASTGDCVGDAILSIVTDLTAGIAACFEGVYSISSLATAIANGVKSLITNLVNMTFGKLINNFTENEEYTCLGCDLPIGLMTWSSIESFQSWLTAGFTFFNDSNHAIYSVCDPSAQLLASNPGATSSIPGAALFEGPSPVKFNAGRSHSATAAMQSLRTEGYLSFLGEGYVLSVFITETKQIQAVLHLNGYAAAGTSYGTIYGDDATIYTPSVMPDCVIAPITTVSNLVGSDPSDSEVLQSLFLSNEPWAGILNQAIFYSPGGMLPTFDRQQEQLWTRYLGTYDVSHPQVYDQLVQHIGKYNSWTASSFTADYASLNTLNSLRAILSGLVVQHMSWISDSTTPFYAKEWTASLAGEHQDITVVNTSIYAPPEGAVYTYEQSNYWVPYSKQSQLVFSLHAQDRFERAAEWKTAILTIIVAAIAFKNAAKVMKAVKFVKTYALRTQANYNLAMRNYNGSESSFQQLVKANRSMKLFNILASGPSTVASLFDREATNPKDYLPDYLCRIRCLLDGASLSLPQVIQS